MIKFQHGSKGPKELWPGHGFWVRVHCDLDIGDMILIQGHDTPLGYGQQMCEISESKMAMRNYGPDTNFGCVYCDLDLGDKTLMQGHGTSLSYGQQLCEMLSISNMAMRSYDPSFEAVYCFICGRQRVVVAR